MPLPEGVADPPVRGPGVADESGDVPVTDSPVTDGSVTDSPAVDGRPAPMAREPRSPVRAVWADWRRPVLVGVGATVVLRLVTEWIGLVSQYGVNFPHRVARQPDLLDQVWNHWDAGYYLYIARYGYPGHLGPSQVDHSIAFAPLYPAGIAVVHAVTRLGYVASAELVSALCLTAALAALYRLCVVDSGVPRGQSAVVLVVAWPTAFFLLAPYPEAMALAAGVLAFLAARRGWWLTAGVFAAAGAMTKYYLVILAVGLAIEVFGVRAGNWRARPRWDSDVGRMGRALGPTVVAVAGWMIYQKVHIGSALAFVRVQGTGWNRHVAAPWTLAATTASDLVHWRFLDTSTASVTELFDAVTVVVMAVVAVYCFVTIRRSYAAVLALCWCVFTFQTYLLGVTREVLVVFPLFVGLGAWALRGRWREPVLLALFIPCGYFLIERFVQGQFAG